ncbi:glyceraldehyde-3-phosphate dehydrogenase-like [Apodemus sylvaticus]|uniref:glyceraldehyde-3-phosphate dehydrogenase-like n=1 Tax=Apodemus sylvaticus TaxID=10129 RepID=UPI002243DC36|nr:glyceraldehyde-3-phosphate dehydrogenase-like [Apodemus sylvaticus]
MVKVSVNKHGCIWLLVTRAAFCSASGKAEIVAINDPFIDLNYMVYMFQYDSTNGKFNSTVKAENRKLVINGKTITIFQAENWDQLKNGAKKIIISTPSADAPMFVMGMNHKKYDNSLKIVSTYPVPPTAYHPPAKVIHDNFGIMEGLMTTVHAITATQKTMNDPSRKLCCDGRGATQNIIPAFTSAAKAVGKMPEVHPGDEYLKEMMLKTGIPERGRIELDSNPLPCTKFNSKWTQDCNAKSKMLELLEEDTDSTL